MGELFEETPGIMGSVVGIPEIQTSAEDFSSAEKARKIPGRG